MKPLIIFVAVVITAALMFSGCGKENGGGQGTAKVYYCPMHPQVKAGKPGVCPICHMDLVPEGSAAGSMPDGITLTDAQVAALGVRLVTPEKASVPVTIRAFSTFSFDEGRRRVVSARFTGRIEQLLVSADGSTVAEGAPLFTYYSAEVVQAQKDLLLSLGNAQNPSLAAAAENRLQLFGLTNAQIAEIKSGKGVQQILPMLSPARGVIISRKVKQGAYFQEGAELYEIADMSTMWNTADVFEEDAGSIAAGSRCTIRAGGKTYTGVVTQVLPQINPQGRTAGIRSSVTNSRGEIKANMSAETEFSGGSISGWFLPEDAVLFTGGSSVVWVTADGANFSPLQVVTGKKLNGRYHIVSGLTGTEQVAASAGYLLDSEGKLRGVHPVKPGKEIAAAADNHAAGTGPGDDTPVYYTGSEKPFNAVCPILGEPLEGKTVTIRYKGKIIGFCCNGCDKKFMKQPDLYLANLSADGKKFLGDAHDE